MREPVFTVFTPTYQRAHTLHRVYESLQRQTFADFEWVIVDDGSTDGTDVLVDGWQRASSFPIRYVRQSNSGKHVAFNRGVQMAVGPLFLTLDSDDGCVPEALERFAFWWNSIPEDEREGFAGVTVLCHDQAGRPIGTPFPTSPFDSNSIELRLRHRVQGEKWGFQRTDVLLRHPFPEPPGVKFVAESVVWRTIDREYKTRYVNESLRIYWTGNGDEASANLSRLSPAVLRGRAMHHVQTLNDLLPWFWVNPLAFAAAAANHVRYGVQLGSTPRTLLADVRAPLAKALVVAMVPVGLAFAVRDRRRPSPERAPAPESAGPKA